MWITDILKLCIITIVSLVCIHASVLMVIHQFYPKKRVSKPEYSVVDLLNIPVSVQSPMVVEKPKVQFVETQKQVLLDHGQPVLGEPPVDFKVPTETDFQVIR
jgi:hypothetical protein